MKPLCQNVEVKRRDQVRAYAHEGYGMNSYRLVLRPQSKETPV